MTASTSTANDLYAYRTASSLIDLRDLEHDQLRAISDEAAEHGDLESVAVISILLAGEEPIYLLSEFYGQEILRRLDAEATEADASAMIDLLADLGHLRGRWLVITDERWDELASEIPVREDEA